MTPLDRDPNDVGITEAWNEAGRRFTVDQIDDPTIYADHMHQQALRDDLFREIVAVRQSTRSRAHFRVRPDYQDGIRVDPGEKDPLHDRTVLHLHEQLSKADLLEVRTTRWLQDGMRRKADENTLWQSKSFRKLTWKCDPLTRVWLDRTRYFQPDLCGFDPSAAYPGPNNPWIIIEVVHHHWPEPEAWDALVALSKANHLVLFYFVKDGEHNNWVNREFGRNPYVLKVAFYLCDGDLYENSTRIGAGDGASNPAASLKLAVLGRKDATLAKELAARKRPPDRQE